MLSFVDANIFSVIFEDEKLLVVLDVLNRVMGESKDLLRLLKSCFWPPVVVLSISPGVLIGQPE